VPETRVRFPFTRSIWKLISCKSETQIDGQKAASSVGIEREFPYGHKKQEQCKIATMEKYILKYDNNLGMFCDT